MNLNGYALVNSDQDAYSWHPTYGDAEARRDWEQNYGQAGLRIVKDVEAVWPDDDYDAIICRAAFR